MSENKRPVKFKLDCGAEIIIDREDYALISKYKWSVQRPKPRRTYLRVVSYKNKQCIAIHRLIMKPKKGQQIDHINGNTFDNRKKNLRICTNQNNSRNAKLKSTNRTGFKGIWFAQNKYRAAITIDRKRIYLGYFDTKIEAAKAYNKAAKKYFGEYARLNPLAAFEKVR